MRRTITLTSLHLSANFTLRQTSEVLSNLLSVKTLAKKVKGRCFEEFSCKTLRCFICLSKAEWRLFPARVLADRLLMPVPDWLDALQGLSIAPPTYCISR